MSYPMYYQPAPTPAVPLRFEFDGGAASWFGVQVLSGLLTIVTLGIALPWATAMRYRWQAEHTLINGQRVVFTGHGADLGWQWLKWWLFCVITLGIYGFWVHPRLVRWVVEHQQVVLPLPPMA